MSSSSSLRRKKIFAFQRCAFRFGRESTTGTGGGHVSPCAHSGKGKLTDWKEFDDEIAKLFFDHIVWFGQKKDANEVDVAAEVFSSRVFSDAKMLQFRAFFRFISVFLSFD